MQILTPEKLRALEMIVGVRHMPRVRLKVISELVEDGFIQSDPYYGAGIPTEEGVRATAPHFMKDITP